MEGWPAEGEGELLVLLYEADKGLPSLNDISYPACDFILDILTKFNWKNLWLFGTGWLETPQATRVWNNKIWESILLLVLLFFFFFTAFFFSSPLRNFIPTPEKQAKGKSFHRRPKLCSWTAKFIAPECFEEVTGKIRLKYICSDVSEWVSSDLSVDYCGKRVREDGLGSFFFLPTLSCTFPPRSLVLQFNKTQC